MCESRWLMMLSQPWILTSSCISPCECSISEKALEAIAQSHSGHSSAMWQVYSALGRPCSPSTAVGTEIPPGVCARRRGRPTAGSSRSATAGSDSVAPGRVERAASAAAPRSAWGRRAARASSPATASGTRWRRPSSVARQV